MRYLLTSTLSISMCLLLLVGMGCDSAGSDVHGRVQILLTDAPLDDVAEANVTIERVELLSADGEAPLVLADTAQAFNLLELQDGLTAPLADVPVPVGTYRQLRLIVAKEATLVMKDSSTTTLKVPSGTHTGIKILLPDVVIDGEGDQLSLTVDFDVSQSFVVAGASGKVLFKPVLKPLSLVVNGEEQVLDDETGEEEG